MRHIFLTLVFISPLFLNANSLQLPEQMIIYSIDRSSAPLQITTRPNAHGIVNDIIHKLFPNVGQYSEEKYPFMKMVEAMDSNPHKNWVTFGSPTWMAPQNKNLSEEPLFPVRHSFLSKTNRDLDSKKDLYGLKVAVIKGFSYPGLVELHKKRKIQFIEVPNHKVALTYLLSSKVDLIPDMDIRLRYHIIRNNLGFANLKFLPADFVIPKYNVHFCYSSSFPRNTRDEIDKKLIQLKKDGTINKIIDSYTSI